MHLRTYQMCRSKEGWAPVNVPSSSEVGKSYLVFVNPWGNVRENICECQGYLWRFKCSHQQKASEMVCGWMEGESLEVQDDEQKKKRICPACGGPTKYEVEVID